MAMPDQSSDYQMMAFDDYRYQRSKKDREDLRGTLFFYDAPETHIIQKVPGFPAIKRVYRLQEGIARLFDNNCFRVEEKLDGYNARIFMHQGMIFGATRGGFICPFTTEWARIWAEDSPFEAFFSDNPGHVLCGEICGDNPYNWQRDPDLPPGAHFFAFEITTPDGVFLPPDKRREQLARYGLPGAPDLGEYSLSETEKLHEILLDLNRHHREGVVLKDLEGKHRLKFVTPNSDIQDLQDTLKIGFDMDAGYLFNRYLRASLFVKEFGLDQGEYAKKLGQAFLDGFPDPGNFSESSRNYVIYVMEKETWEKLHGMLKSNVLIRYDGITPATVQGREMLRVDFRRVYQKSSHRYRRILRGHLHQD